MHHATNPEPLSKKVTTITLAPETKVLVFDIEGTIGSKSFVFDVMYPFAKERYSEKYITDDRKNTLAAAREKYALAPHNFPNMPTDPLSLLHYLHDKGVENPLFKDPTVKAIQTEIWTGDEGFKSGLLKGHLFEDFVTFINRTETNQFVLSIFSSGPVPAQLDYFTYSVAGNIRDHFNGNHFDATKDGRAGPKTEPESYAKIARHLHYSGKELVFFTDILKEAVAASENGWQVILVERPDNDVVGSDDWRGGRIQSFDQILLPDKLDNKVS